MWNKCTLPKSHVGWGLLTLTTTLLSLWALRFVKVKIKKLMSCDHTIEVLRDFVGGIPYS